MLLKVFTLASVVAVSSAGCVKDCGCPASLEAAGTDTTFMLCSTACLGDCMGTDLSMENTMKCGQAAAADCPTLAAGAAAVSNGGLDASVDCVGADAMECSKCACLQTPASPCSADDSTWCSANLAGVGMNCMQYVACPQDGGDTESQTMVLFLTMQCPTELEACMGSEECQAFLAVVDDDDGGGNDGSGDGNDFIKEYIGKPAVKELVDCANAMMEESDDHDHSGADDHGNHAGDSEVPVDNQASRTNTYTTAQIDLYIAFGGADKVGPIPIAQVQAVWNTCLDQVSGNRQTFKEFMADSTFAACLEMDAKFELLIHQAYDQYNTDYDFSGASQLVSGFAAVAVVAALAL